MLLKISEFFTYSALFAVLIVMKSTLFPFVVGKCYFFRLCVETALMFLLFSWAFEMKSGQLEDQLRKLIRRPLFLAVSLFVFFFLLSCVFAYDPYTAFWSTFQRGEGGFQMIHYYVFFILTLLLFTDERHWRRAFVCSLITAALLILYGILAAALTSGFIGPYRRPTGEPVASTTVGRLFSTARFQGALGNPNFMAAYLLFAMFYVLYLWNTSCWKSIWVQRVFYGAVLSLFVLFFVLTQTRGALLGLLIATCCFLLYLILFARRFRKTSLICLAALAILVVLLYALRGSSVIGNSPASHIISISRAERTFQTRIWAWNSAWKGFKERPILGWGPENFSTVFDKYFDPRHYIPGQTAGEAWFDRAHSVVFDYLTETGSLGLLSYLNIFVVFYICLYRFLSRRQTKSQKKFSISNPFLIHALLVCLPIAYLIQGLALFDVLPTYINLILFLAFSVYYFDRTTTRNERLA